MANDWDLVEVDPGAGGAKVAGETFTQGSDTVFVAASTLAVPADGGGFDLVGTSSPLPIGGTVTVGNSTLAVTQSGSWTVAVSGSVTVTGAVTVSGTATVSGTVAISNSTLAVTQSGSWTVAATQSGSWSVTVANSTLAVTQSGSWTVGVSGTVTVAGTVAISNTTLAVTQSGSWTVTLGAGTNNIGDVDVLTLPATAAEGAALPSVFVLVAGDDGTDTQPLQLNEAGDLKVTLDSESVTIANSTLAVTQSGSWTVAVSGSVTVTGAVTVSGTATVSGTVAISNSTLAVTQSGSWTVGVSGTVAISASSLPLPTGAATDAKLDDLAGVLTAVGDDIVEAIEGIEGGGGGGATVPTTMVCGRKSDVGNSAAALLGSATPTLTGVNLRANSFNTAPIYVGDSDVSVEVDDPTCGFPIAPGTECFFAIDDASKIYLISADSSQTVYYQIR